MNDNISYENLGFDNFLSRKSRPMTSTNLEDITSLNTDQFGGSIDGTVKFVRVGLSGDKPIEGEKAGAIYYETDTKKFFLWTGVEWLSEVLS